MPIPTPGKDETEDKFIQRCMGNDVMNKEFPDSKQRLAVCHRTWDRKKKDSAQEKQNSEKQTEENK